MAFIRKRGNSYYLVHNVREEGRVHQLQLVSLGRRPRISDEVVRAVTARHPFIRVDWRRLRQQASHDIVQPTLNDAGYLFGLLGEIRGLHLDIADFQWPALEGFEHRELRAQFAAELRLLRSTLEVKLDQLRRRRFSGSSPGR